MFEGLRQPALVSVLLLACSAASVTGAAWSGVSFAAVHSAELRQNHLLVEFTTPDSAQLGDALDTVLNVSILRTQELVFSTGGGGDCSTLVAGRGLVLRDCVLGSGNQSVELHLHSPLRAGAPYVLELQSETTAAAGLRRCMNGSSTAGYFVKTGGRLDSGSVHGNSSATPLDRCCRRDGSTCHTFVDTATCEAGKRSIACLSCAVDLGDLGCPEANVEVVGYTRRYEDVACPGLSPHGGVPDVSACAAMCDASATCAAFTVDSGGRCLLTASSCCPGTGLVSDGALSYFRVGRCGPAADRWHASLSLKWRTASGATVEYTSESVTIVHPGDTQGHLLLAGGPAQPGHIARFSATVLPDLGLIYGSAGLAITIQLQFLLGARGEVPGDTLLFVPLPVSPWDFGVSGGSLLWSSEANSSARVIFDDLPESITCRWHRVSGAANDTGGANSILCKVGTETAGELGARSHSLVLSVPGVSGAGFSASWAMYLESAGFASLAVHAGALAFAPVQPRIGLLSSTVRVPDARAAVQVAFALGLLAEKLTLVVRMPSWVVGDLTACGPVHGWPFPTSAAEPVLDGSACRLEGVATGDPSTEYRMRLLTVNRGVAPGTKGLLMLSMQWDGRSEMVSSEDFYNLVEPFAMAQATMALGTRGSAGPLVLTLRTAAAPSHFYEGCEREAMVQISVSHPGALVILSAAGERLVAHPGPADCGLVLLEVHTDDPQGFPAPAGCAWDAMAAAGDLLTIAFGTASGFAGLQSDREYAFVLFAEAADLGEEAGPAPLAVVTLCGKDAAESAELQVTGTDGAPYRSVAALGSGAALQLHESAASDAVAGVFSLDLLATGLSSMSAPVQHVRVLALPLLGFGFTLTPAGTIELTLRAWWDADATGPANAEAAVQGLARSLGGSSAPPNCVELTVPAAWQAQLGALRVTLTATEPASSGLGWTGFAAHPYVFMEFAGQAGSVKYGEVLRLVQADATGWLQQTPFLRHVKLRTGSQVGGALHRVDLLLSLGFRTEGITVTITPPLGMVVVDLTTGTPPGGHVSGPTPVTYLDSRGRPVRYPNLYVDDASGTVYSGRQATFTAPSGTFWPAATYLWSLYLLNPEHLMEELEWSLTVKFSRGFPMSTGASPTASTVEETIGLAQGAFAVVRALWSCSVAPSSMQLGADNTVRVSFTLPIHSDAVNFAARPFLMTLIAPSIFTVRTPIVFHSLQNLPPRAVLMCEALLLSQVLCRLPMGFVFVAGAAYAFEVLVANPVVADWDYAALEAQYSTGWALQLAYSHLAEGAPTPLNAICENIPRAPAATTDRGQSLLGSFPLYQREMSPLFFRIGASREDLLPHSISGLGAAVVVTFRPASAQLPRGSVLLVAAPLGWAWAPSGNPEGRAAVVLQGTTQDFHAALAPHLASRPPNHLELLCERAIQGGQVYGFRTLVRVPGAESDDVQQNLTAANVWTLELLSESAMSALVHEGRYDAVVRAFDGLRARALSACAVLPLALVASEPTGVLVSFKLSSHLSPGDYIWIQTPLHFRGEEPCDDSLERAVPLPAELLLSGFAYPQYQALPRVMSCSWHSTPDQLAEMRLHNDGSSIIQAQACLVSVRIRFPTDGEEASASQAAHLWRIGSSKQDGGVLDAPCDVERPFRLVVPQQALVAPAILDARRTSANQPLMLVAFSLQAAAPEPVVFTLRAPLGFRSDDYDCGRFVQPAPEAVPAPYVGLVGSAGTPEVLCISSGGHGGLPGMQSFAPDAPRPSPLLEGTLSFHVPGLALDAGTKYVFGITLVAPQGIPWRNSWYMEVSGHVGTFPGWDLLSIEDARVSAAFLGFAMSPDALPYNDVTISFMLTAPIDVEEAALILSVPLDFHLSTIRDVVCMPFTNFSIHSAGDVCELVGIDTALGCFNRECVRFRPAQPSSGESIWLEKGRHYDVTIQVQNPMDCVACSTPWALQLLTHGLSFVANADGIMLVGGVKQLHIVPTHPLGGVQVLLNVEVSLSTRLLVHDRLEFTVPPGWRLDLAFCASPAGQAAVVGLQAPPTCTEEGAVLTVYETDLPPLLQPTVGFGLAATTPSFTTWRAEQESWLRLFQGSAALPPPLEFALVVRRTTEAAVPLIVAAAAKVQAYELLPNLGLGLQLMVSSTLLSSRTAILISFVPSEKVDALVNSVGLKASLPYWFGGCRLLWEEPPERRATRNINHPIFMFAGEPRCTGALYEATLLGVLLNTSNKAHVTLHLANVTAPPPPYVSTRSMWEITLQRLRAGRPPDPLDIALGVEGPGSFGELSLLSLGAHSGGQLGDFVSNFAAGEDNVLSFRFTVAVPLLAGSTVRVVAPPAFALLPETFVGLSRHFVRRPAASDLRLERGVPLQQLHVPGAPGVEADLLHVRVLEDSLAGEELHFQVAVRNPGDSLTAEIQHVNRWIIETVDEMSGVVTNSNRMTWLSFTPKPGFNASSVASRNSVRVGATTTVDIVLGVDGTVRIPPAPSQVVLEVLAPASFVFPNSCLGELGGSSGLPGLPFVSSCAGAGRLARVSGVAPESWLVWQAGAAYRLALVVGNSNSSTPGTKGWSFQLWAENAPSAAEALPTSSLAIGPAEALEATRMRSWSPPLLDEEGRTVAIAPAFSVLPEGARILIVDGAWPSAEGLNVAADEAVVFSPEGYFGALPADLVRNVPADNALPRPVSQSRRLLVRETAVRGYDLEGASAAAGYAASLPGLPGLYLVVAVQIAMPTSLRLAGLRLSSPPHFIFDCSGLVVGNLPPGNLAQDASAGSSGGFPTCREFRDMFATALQLELFEAAWRRGYPIGTTWWFSVPAELAPPSGWAEERQDWEAEILFSAPLDSQAGSAGGSFVDTVSDERLLVERFASTPRTDADASLLYFRVAATYEGTGSATYISLTYAIRETASSESFTLVVRAPRNVPFARDVFAEGRCLEDEDDLLFPSDRRLGREPASCTAVSLERSRAGGGQGEALQVRALPAEDGLPERLEFSDRVAVVLPPACRPPLPPCADFFGLALGGERLLARSGEGAAQLATGQIGRDVSAACPRARPPAALWALLLLLLVCSAAAGAEVQLLRELPWNCLSTQLDIFRDRELKSLDEFAVRTGIVVSAEAFEERHTQRRQGPQQAESPISFAQQL